MKSWKIGLMNWLVIGLVLVNPARVNQTGANAEPPRVCFGRGCWWVAGVNLPWVHYGHDFGQASWPTGSWSPDGVSQPATRAKVDQDFAFLAEHGVKFVRWFVFGDGRASPEFDSYGRVTGLDHYFFADMDAALALAEKHDLNLILVLLDYHWLDPATLVNGVQLGGHKAVINDQHLGQSFIDKALLPMLRRYGDCPRIVWEIINEPEWRLSGIPGFVPSGETVALERMQAFVQTVSLYLHQETGQKVTLGSAKGSWLSLWQRYRSRPIGLDIYQAHHYDWMGESEAPFVSAASLNLDKSVILGEFPTRGSTFSLSQYLGVSWEGGYAGSLAWSLKGEDSASDFSRVAEEFQDWVNYHPIEIPWPNQVFLPVLRRQ